MNESEKENIKKSFLLVKNSAEDTFSFRSLNLNPIISPKLIKEITGKCNFTSLTSLSLKNCNPKIKKISGLRDMISLKTLDLSCNQIGKIEGIYFLINLTELNISDNKIKSIENIVNYKYIIENLEEIAKIGLIK